MTINPGYWGDAGRFFKTPHDRPPKWLFMLTTYLDESGQETKDAVIVAGFLGTDEQWNRCAEEWKLALGNRKLLHMKELRWRKDRIRKLLEVLGPIPHRCGLRAILGGVRVSDYYDLIGGTKAEKLTKGYRFCVMAVMDSIAKNAPRDEPVKLIFERQDEYEVHARNIFDNNKHLVTASGEQRFSGIEFIPKDTSVLTQPADYLAYAILQDYRDPKSQKSKWCSPILKIVQDAYGFVPDRDGMRKIINNALQTHPEFAAKR